MKSGDKFATWGGGPATDMRLLVGWGGWGWGCVVGGAVGGGGCGGGRATDHLHVLTV